MEYRVAPAEASGLEAHSVDLVTVAQSLHWFRIDEFYAEAHRVLKPRGVLAVWSYGMQHVDDPRIDEVVQHFYSEIVGPYWPPERRLVENGYRDVAFPFEELKPPHFVMQEHWPLERLLGYFRSWSATGRYVAEKGVDPVTALGEKLSALWGDPGGRASSSGRWPSGWGAASESCDPVPGGDQHRQIPQCHLMSHASLRTHPCRLVREPRPRRTRQSRTLNPCERAAGTDERSGAGVLKAALKADRRAHPRARPATPGEGYLSVGLSDRLPPVPAPYWII